MTYSYINNKEELLGVLQTMRYSAIYNIFALISLDELFKSHLRGEVTLTNLKTRLPEGTLTLDEFVTDINNFGDHALLEIKRNAIKDINRGLFKDVFRITKSYCEDTEQIENFKNEPYFDFARILVNCFSHDHKMRFGRHDLTLLPVKYNGIVITPELEGQQLKAPLETLLNLADDIILFTKNNLPK